MNNYKLFIAVIISFLFSSCLRLDLSPRKEYPYTIIYNGNNNYEGELEYLDSLNLLNLHIKAYYIPDSTKNIETHVILDVENRGEKEFIFDSSSVILKFNNRTSDLVFIEPNSISIKKDGKGSIDYFFDSKPIHNQTESSQESEIYILILSPVINGNNEKIIKYLVLKR